MRILIITDYPPYPPISGDSLRVYNLIKRLAKQHQIYLAIVLWTPNQEESLKHLRQFCHRVVTASLRWQNPLKCLPGIMRYIIEGKPIELLFLYSDGFVRRIKELIVAEDFDIVNIEHSRMALYLEAVPPGARCKRILTFHNVASYQYGRIFRIERRIIAKVRAFLLSFMMHRWEPRYASRFDRCLTVSDADRKLLLDANPELRIQVVPNGVDTELYQPLPSEERRPSLLFIGTMSYAPCVDAALYFCRKIFPRILNAVGQAELWIVGADPAPEVSALNGDAIHVTGKVADVIPFYNRSSISVVPLRAGGGTRLKILEAMALGRPVVSTTVGCEGLNVIPGEHLLVADSPKQFSDRVIDLLTDRKLYDEIRNNARRLVVKEYDWSAIVEQLNSIYLESVRPIRTRHLHH